MTHSKGARSSLSCDAFNRDENVTRFGFAALRAGSIFGALRKGGCSMSLQFLSEAGVYVPRRDAIKFTAMTGAASHIPCYTTRSALAAIGCTAGDPPIKLVERFQRNRLSIEIAAMIKYRRATSKPRSLEIGGEDLDGL
jgi:hypothetical protein